MPELRRLGWSDFFERQRNPRIDEGHVPARVVEEQRGSYRIEGEQGGWRAELSGRLRHDAASGAVVPCVGDWVMVRPPHGGETGGPAIIHRVLERRTRFARKEAGSRSAEQVVAANADTVFLVQSLNRDLNPRRLERYLALLWESGAEPVVVLSKADLCPDVESARGLVEEAAPGVAVLVVRALDEGGLAPLEPYLAPGRTAALVGSSGVGKSTIVNRLAGEERMAVAGLRADGRGRHTTTARRLVHLASGAMLLDTPGMRTVLLAEAEEGIGRSFPDVARFASACRFRDCAHGSEPGCAVRAALEEGALDGARFRSYEKLRREARHQAMKSDHALRLAERRRWKRIHRELRQRPDKRG